MDAGAAVASDGSAIGTVVSVAGNLALAVLPLELTLDADATLKVGTQGARPRALTPGLAR